MFGKQTECAIAVMSRLAEVYDGGQTRLTSAELADARGLPQPIVAKILSALAQADLVVSTPGPGGGFTLAQTPDHIAIHDVFTIFERTNNYREICLFGGGICGGDDPCPLHEQMSGVLDAMDVLLHETTFGVYQPQAPTKPSAARSTKKPGGKRGR